MAVTPWKILDTKYLYQRKGMALRIDQCETMNGSVFDPYVIECGTWVNVIALTKVQEVVLVNQYRHGVKQVMLEIPLVSIAKHGGLPQALHISALFFAMAYLERNP